MKRILSALIALVMIAGCAVIVIADEPSSWAKEEVEAAIALDLVPEELQKNYTSPVTRGQVAGMFINLLEKASGKTAGELITAHGSEIDETAFTDTKDEKVFQANALGIIKGTGHNKFSPDGSLKRAQIAAIINRTAGVMGFETEGFTHGFTDITDNYSWAYDELGWPVANGIIKGVGGTRFSPGGDLTTEQAILITYRAYNVLTANVLTVYVSPEGSASPDGSRTAPYGSITAARDALRSMDKAEYTSVDIVLMPGRYVISEPVRFDSRDGGVRYIGEDGAVIVGGVALKPSDFKKATGAAVQYIPEEARGNVLQIDLTKLGFSKNTIREMLEDDSPKDLLPRLSVNGSLQTIARFPNEDWINIEDGWMIDQYGERTDKTDNDDDVEHWAKQYCIVYGDEYFDRVMSWHDKSIVRCAAHYAVLWVQDNAPVISFSETSPEMLVPYKGGYAPAAGGLLYWYNLPEELDAPGEFYIDSDAILYYYPCEGFDSATLSIPLSEGLVVLDHADGITFENISFESSVDGGIKGTSDGFTLKDCVISSILKSPAVDVRGNDILIQGNLVYNVATDGICIHSGDPATLTFGNSLVYNNVVHDWGIYHYPYAEAIDAYGCGITVSHNTVYSSNAAGIDGGDAYITIEYNHIFDVLKTSDDIGATGNTGFAENITRYNFIHDIGAVGAAAEAENLNKMGSAAIYWDGAGSYAEAYGNVIKTVRGHGVIMNGGRYLSVHGNLIIDCSFWYVQTVATPYAEALEKGFTGTTNKYPDYIHSAVWQKKHPETYSVITDLSKTDPEDPNAWCAPTGDVVMNNWAHFNKFGRKFSNWGVRPYYIEDYVYKFSGDNIDVVRGSGLMNDHTSSYNSRRDSVNIEELFGMAEGVIEINWAAFQTIGVVSEDWNLDFEVPSVMDFVQ